MIIHFDAFDSRHSGSHGAGLSSLSTKASVEAAISADRRISGARITASILGPYVVLEGCVSTRADEGVALELARSIASGCQVISRMMLRPAS